MFHSISSKDNSACKEKKKKKTCLFSLLEHPKERGHSTNVECMSGDCHDMVENTRDLSKQHCTRGEQRDNKTSYYQIRANFKTCIMKKKKKKLSRSIMTNTHRKSSITLCNLLPWPKKSLRLRYSWGWSTVHCHISCDIDFDLQRKLTMRRYRRSRRCRTEVHITWYHMIELQINLTNISTATIFLARVVKGKKYVNWEPVKQYALESSLSRNPRVPNQGWTQP